MNLKRFDKNKKQKEIIIGSIIGLTLIIGGISLYRSFAMYEEKATFDVLKGTIPNFRPIYAEKLLNGTDPVLGEGMIPVEIGKDGTVTKADIMKDWYSYETKQWANAVILADGIEDAYKAGETINEEDIESYFVWIPKYSYKLFDKELGKYTTATEIEDKSQQAIEIKFGTENTIDNGIIDEEPTCATPMLENKVQGASGQDGQCVVNDWMTHPAFLAFGGNGFWVGKFETSKKDTDNIQIKPNASSWKSITIGDSFKNSRDYQKELQSHLMKNTEWGAVAYLTQSIYGRCDKEGKTCTEVVINSNSGYLTGYANNSNTTYFQGTTDASTTGNYSGIYDMSGGIMEQMASVMLDGDNASPKYGTSGLTDTEFDDRRYYDVYSYNADYTHWERRILGDATGEEGPFTKSGSLLKSSMWDDYSLFVYPSNPWFTRGGSWLDFGHAGVFDFQNSTGEKSVFNGFRIVLAVQ